MMAMKWLSLTLLVSTAVQYITNAESHPQNMSTQNRLLKDLLANYGFTTMRPVYNMSNPVTVELRLILAQVIQLNERYQTIEIEAWITQRWTDEYMAWNPDDHDGVDHLYVHKSKLWLPDITVYKNVDRNFESYKDIAVYVSNTGVCTWGTPVILKCTCLIDASLFPFDTQVCEIRFTSWVHDITELNLTEYSENNLQSFYVDVGVWELLKVTARREETPYEDGTVFPDLSYFIHLRRRPLFHVLQIILPCVLLSLLNLMVFVLPLESGERISLGVTNLLSLVLFQELISGSLPPTSDKAPIIGYYFTPMIVLACTSIVCTVAILNVFYRDNRRPIPRWVRHILFDILARLVCHRDYADYLPKTVKLRPDGENVQVTREPGSREAARSLTGGEASSLSKSLYLREGEWDDTRFTRAQDVTQRLRAVPCPRILSSPVVRARRHVQCEVETRQERDKTGKMNRSHNWREVAFVMNRTALVLSSLITLASMVATVISFIVHFQELD